LYNVIACTDISAAANKVKGYLRSIWGSAGSALVLSGNAAL